MYYDKIRNAPRNERTTVLVEEVYNSTSMAYMQAAVLEVERALGDLRKVSIVVHRGDFGPMVSLQSSKKSPINILNSNIDGVVTSHEHSANALKFIQDFLGLGSEEPLSLEGMMDRYRDISAGKNIKTVGKWYDEITDDIIHSIKNALNA